MSCTVRDDVARQSRRGDPRPERPLTCGGRPLSPLQIVDSSTRRLSFAREPLPGRVGAPEDHPAGVWKGHGRFHSPSEGARREGSAPAKADPSCDALSQSPAKITHSGEGTGMSPLVLLGGTGGSFITSHFQGPEATACVCLSSAAAGTHNPPHQTANTSARRRQPTTTPQADQNPSKDMGEVDDSSFHGPDHRHLAEVSSADFVFGDRVRLMGSRKGECQPDREAGSLDWLPRLSDAC